MRPRSLARRLLTRGCFYLLLGAVASVLFAFSAWLFTNPLVGFSASALTTGNGWWSVNVTYRPASIMIESIRDRTRAEDWGPEQATGVPNTPSMGDIRTAWASATPDGHREWLLLEFDQAVAPASIEVHETYNPGAIDRIAALDARGAETTIWTGRDPLHGAVNATVAVFPMHNAFETRAIKLHIDSPAVPGWNEIDAVALVMPDGQKMWARNCLASSTYARQTDPATVLSPERLVPRWTGFHSPTPAYANRAVNAEHRTAVAFGWPWPALAAFGDQPTGMMQPMRAFWAGGAQARAPAPWYPVWPGLPLDALVWGTMLWLLSLALFLPARAVREMMRMRRGLCPRCAYDLRYDFARGCSECGFLRSGLG